MWGLLPGGAKSDSDSHSDLASVRAGVLVASSFWFSGARGEGGVADGLDLYLQENEVGRLSNPFL